MEIRPVGASSMRTDGQMTTVAKLVVALRNFANAPNKTMGSSTP